MAKDALKKKIASQSSKKAMKNRAMLPRTAGLRTLSELTTEMTKAGLDPSRIQERADILAKVAGAKRKRQREEEEAEMDVDEDADMGEEGVEGEWMDVDGEEAPKLKRVKGNTGSAIAKGARHPRSNRQLAGMRDEAVSMMTCLVFRGESAHRSSGPQQASKAVKLRNLGQRERNMHARAGESDRAIKVKMVGSVPSHIGDSQLIHVLVRSPNTCSQGSGRWARRIVGDCIVRVFCILSSLCCIAVFWYYVHDGCCTIRKFQRCA